MLDPSLHVFDDDDRIVHHDADRQHQSEQRQRIEAEPQCLHEGERAHDCHRHGNQRDEGGPPFLQKQEHHQSDEDHRDAERSQHLSLRFLDEGGGVIHDAGLESRWESGPERLEAVAHLFRRLQRVGAGELVDVHPHARLTVEPAHLVVLLRPQFNPGNIPQAHDHSRVATRSGLQFLDDHIAKLLGGHQPSERCQRRLKHLPLRRRLLPDVAGGDLQILALKRRADVSRGDADGCHSFRVEPCPHAVVALADEVYVANPINPEQFVPNLDSGIVGEKCFIVEGPAGCVALGGEVDDHQRRR